MQVENLVYNLPGHGSLRATLFGHSTRIYQLLERYGYISRMHELNQLGALRDILHGAHHTRYEYVFTQLSLVTELAHLRGANLGLRSNRNDLGVIPGTAPARPTGMQLIQTLVLVTNMGHLPGTFAASRAWLHKIRTDQDVYDGFASGLSDFEVSKLDEFLLTDDVYNVHLLVAAFLLRRKLRPGSQKAEAEFALAVLDSYLDYGNNPRGIDRLWDLFRTVRKITYLTLDCHYSSVPFSLELGSIVLNLGRTAGQIFGENAYELTFDHLELALRDSVYMTGDALLATSRVSTEVLGRIDAARTTNWRNIRPIERLLAPHTGATTPGDPEDVFGAVNRTTRGTDWSSTSQLLLSFPRGVEPAVLPETSVAYEQALRQSVGVQSCWIGAHQDATRQVTKLAIGMRVPHGERWLKPALRVTSAAARIECGLSSEYVRQHVSGVTSNRAAVLRFFLSGLIQDELGIELEYDRAVPEPPIKICRGGRQMEREIRAYATAASTAGASDDEVHEIKTVADYFAANAFNRTCVAYLGSLRFTEDGTRVAEFDGVVVFPNVADPHEDFLCLIEGKNQRNGHTAALTQLRRQVPKIFPTTGPFDRAYDAIGTAGGVARISLA